MLNELALDVFFRHRHQRVLGDVPFDFETNPDNYDENSVLKEAGVVPVMTTIFEGMRLVLTRNLNKRNDFVNGMLCTLISYDADKDCIAVRTETGKVLAVPACHRAVWVYPQNGDDLSMPSWVCVHSAEVAGPDCGSHHSVLGRGGLQSSRLRCVVEIAF